MGGIPAISQAVLGDLAGGDAAAGADPILDDDLLPERLAHLFPRRSRHDVVAAAGGVGDDQRDGTARIILSHRLGFADPVRMIAYFPSILGLGIDNIRGKIASLRELGSPKGDIAPRTSRSLKGQKIQLLAPWQRLSALVLEVAFQQHMGGNCIPRCSKCHFMIAWAAACVANFILRRMGAIPEVATSSVKPAAKGTLGQRG
jgi:hypothetical protein